MDGVNVDLVNSADRPSMDALRTAACHFLEASLPGVDRVHIVKLASVEVDKKTWWEAEAEVWQPNATIQSLRLSTHLTRPVLDEHLYLLRLDSQLNVLAYGLKKELRQH
jgi:hypothetical protein